MSPFQYGVDFTLIGGFQAMVGFLKVRMADYSSAIDGSLTRVMEFRSLGSRLQTPLLDGISPTSVSN
jgi:hypothetical protein